VEDNAPFCKVLQQILEQEGYSVKISANGKEALSFIESNKYQPDLIITDIIMPEMEGLEFIRKIKLKYAGIRIVAISGGGYHVTAPLPLKTAKLFGANLTFEKPLDHPKFLNDIRKLLK